MIRFHTDIDVLCTYSSFIVYPLTAALFLNAVKIRKLASGVGSFEIHELLLLVIELMNFVEWPFDGRKLAPTESRVFTFWSTENCFCNRRRRSRVVIGCEQFDSPINDFCFLNMTTSVFNEIRQSNFH